MRSEVAVVDDDKKNKCKEQGNSRKRKNVTDKHKINTLKKHKAEQFNMSETEYYFENGFRKVYPYFFTFHTFCKGKILCENFVFM